MTYQDDYSRHGSTQPYSPGGGTQPRQSSGATQPRHSPSDTGQTRYTASGNGATQPRRPTSSGTGPKPPRPQREPRKTEFEWKDRPEPTPPYGMIIGVILVVLLLLCGIGFLVAAGIRSRNERIPETPAVQETMDTTEAREAYILNISDDDTRQDIHMPELATGSFTGSLETSRQENSFTYTAPHSGTYGFVLSDMDSGANAIIRVYDPSGKLLISSSGVATAELDSGVTYDILVIQSVNFTDYRLIVYVPNQIKDISNAASVTDRIEFGDQLNQYSFTAPVSGIYEFQLTETMNGFRAILQIFDSHGYMLTSTSSGANVELQAGEAYLVTVAQNADRGSYKLAIGIPKQTRDLTGYDAVTDAITFDGQINTYTYTAPTDGTYTFHTEDTTSGGYTIVTILDPYNDTVLKYSNSKSSVALEAGVTYSIQVTRSSDSGSYKLKIVTP